MVGTFVVGAFVVDAFVVGVPLGGRVVDTRCPEVVVVGNGPSVIGASVGTSETHVVPAGIPIGSPVAGSV